MLGGYLKHEPVLGEEIYEKKKLISKYLKFSNVITTVNMQSKNNLYTHLQHFISILNARNTAA